MIEGGEEVPKKKNSGSSDGKILAILKKIGSFFVFLKDKIVDFFVFLKDKIVDIWDAFMGKNGRKFGIRYKILLGFIIPIIFITVGGFASYSKAKQGMRDRYEKSTLETIKMMSSQMDIVAKFIVSESAKFAADQDLAKLSIGAFQNSLYDRTKVFQDISNNVQATQITNSYISNVYIIQKSDFKNISTKSNVIDGFFEEYYETCEKIDKRGNVVKWIDSHPIIDSRMNLDPEYDAYLFCYQQLQSGNAAIIVMDVSKQGIQEFLDDVDLGDGTVLGFVTMNGRELLSRKGEFEDDGKTVFAGRDYYKTVLNSEVQDGILEVEYNGDDCVLFYSKCEGSGNVITAMVPVSLITSEAASIWWLTIILVIIAMVVVLVIAFVISSNIQKNVNSVSKGLGAVAKGNLTVKVRVDGHDEFVDLADATTNMISNTKNLVAKVDTAAEGVADSAKSVQGASKTLGNCSDDIMRAMGEMSDGMERQKKYADECVNATDRLSNEITNVSTQLGNIKGIVDETNRLISESVKLLQSLGDKARETTKATDSVKSSVSALLDETGKINSFVNVIKNISSQTHLLSLNASIEAARAGEAGRGFSVVAEEIRTLATESSRSAGEIKKLVDGINAQTDSSVGSVDMAQNIADEQFVLVNNSIELFDQMKASMESLTEELTNIGRAASAADQRRVEAVSAVDDISEIINESTANADTVIAALDRLKKNVDHLDDTAAKLGENMDELKNEVRVFRI